MLPPIDDTVLRANPDFCKIYKTLTTVKLNPDGTSTLDARQQKERDAVRTVCFVDYMAPIYIFSSPSTFFFYDIDTDADYSLIWG